MAAPWLAAMAGHVEGLAAVIDGGDYAIAGRQSLEFSDLGDIVSVSADQSISTEGVDKVQRLIPVRSTRATATRPFPGSSRTSGTPRDAGRRADQAGSSEVGR